MLLEPYKYVVNLEKQKICSGTRFAAATMGGAARLGSSEDWLDV